MKKSIIIFCFALTALSLTAFLINWNDSATNQVDASSSKIAALDKQVLEVSNDNIITDFFYDVGTRFRAIKKEDLGKAKSIFDFLPEEKTKRIVSYKSVKVIILDDYKQTDISETGNSDILTKAQINLLQSVNYSTNILIRTDYQQKNKETNELEDNYSTPYLTIVPEKQAIYSSGNDALIKYLKENSKEKTTIAQENKLQPGKLYFTVTKKGTITNVNVVQTSGYISIDKTMIELIINLPEKWEPAENSKGEKVDQKLVFSFGLIGC